MNIFNLFKRKQPQIQGVEIKIYEADCEQSAEHFFRLQIENERLKEQLRQCENDFHIRVGLEVQMIASGLAKEIAELKQQLELKD